MERGSECKHIVYTFSEKWLDMNDFWHSNLPYSAKYEQPLNVDEPVMDFASLPVVEDLVSPIVVQVIACVGEEGGQPRVAREVPTGRDDNVRTTPEQADARYYKETPAPVGEGVTLARRSHRAVGDRCSRLVWIAAIPEPVLMESTSTVPTLDRCVSCPHGADKFPESPDDVMEMDNEFLE